MRHFGSHEEFFTTDLAFSDGNADLFLVVVHLRTVEMPKSRGESFFDHLDKPSVEHAGVFGVLGPGCACAEC
jgi:hypothetical protein